MSQQGGRPARHEDDWWGQLYDESTEDTGPTSAPDSLDDRFTSARNAVAGRPGGTGHTGGTAARTPRQESPREPAVPTQRAASPPTGPTAPPPPGQTTASPPGTAPTGAPPGQHAPWEPPPAEPEAPVTFPPVPDRAGDRAEGARAAARTYEPEPPGARPPVQGGPAGRAESAPDRASEQTPVPGPVPEPVPAPSAEPAIPAQPAAPPDASERPAVSRPPATPFAGPPAVATALDLPVTPPPPPSSLDYVGSGPPTYAPEPTALPAADPDVLDELVADTVLDGARYGACTLRAVSMRGDSARYRGEPRRDSLLTARFGTGEQALVLVAMATGARATPDSHLAAAEACQLIGRAVGRSHQRLVEDIRAARRGDLKSGLHRLADRSLGKLRASAVEQDLDPEEYTASLRCLLLPADPDCRTRVFFGVGEGGLFRLRGGEWHDIEPRVSPADTTGEPVLGFGSAPAETPEGDRLTMDLGIPTPPSPYEPAPEPPREPFRFRASVARPGDVLVMGTCGLAEPLRGEPALCAYLARRWSGRTPPGLAAFLADTQVRVKGYADDRTAAAVWEA
ncbi:protein phosphatase 2C domain-containing protein [Streptomyces sp. NPDC101151]|uniref:protein phosphatase 2C domain-containing protein n=1 Tax=Streptomyces sp. NPDC101151 TaxID=3366115 RepID=UPI00380BEE69